VGNEAFVIIGKFNWPTRRRVDRHWRPCVVSISVPRCAEAVGHSLTFDSMNVRSLSPSKLDDLLVEFRDCHATLMF